MTITSFITIISGTIYHPSLTGLLQDTMLFLVSEGYPARYFYLNLKVHSCPSLMNLYTVWSTLFFFYFSQHCLKKHCGTITWEIPHQWTSPPTQLKDLQGHGDPRLLGAHQRPVAGAEVLTGRQQQQHGHLVSKLQQLAGVHTVLVRLSQTHMKICYRLHVELHFIMPAPF